MLWMNEIDDVDRSALCAPPSANLAGCESGRAMHVRVRDVRLFFDVDGERSSVGGDRELDGRER